MKKPAAVGPRHGGVGHVQEVGEELREEINDADDIVKRPASADIPEIDDAEKSDASDESGVGAWREDSAP